MVFGECYKDLCLTGDMVGLYLQLNLTDTHVPIFAKWAQNHYWRHEGQSRAEKVSTDHLDNRGDMLQMLIQGGKSTAWPKTFEGNTSE